MLTSAYSTLTAQIYYLGTHGKSLYFMWDTSVEPPSMESIQVVQEFAEVFPTDLLGVPPDRYNYFSINLESYTNPYLPSLVILHCSNILSRHTWKIINLIGTSSDYIQSHYTS